MTTDNNNDGMTTPSPTIEIRTLGRYDIRIDGRPLRFGRRAPMRALQLLALLATRERQTTGLGTLSDLLWPDADGADAQRALATTLHRLRRMLGIPQAIRLVGGQMWIDADICEVDAWRFEHALRQARDPREVASALALYRGPFLTDDPSPWALATRERLERMVTAAHQLVKERDAPLLPWRWAM
jgi:LuxR family transcriptional regulator, maltose regulon positive regulatory protein